MNFWQFHYQSCSCPNLSCDPIYVNNPIWDQKAVFVLLVYRILCSPQSGLYCEHWRLKSKQHQSVSCWYTSTSTFHQPQPTCSTASSICLTPMAVGLSQSLAQRSGTVSRISSVTRQSAPTLSDVCWRRICLRDTSACSALEVDNFMRYINLLTYLLTYLSFVMRKRAVIASISLLTIEIDLSRKWKRTTLQHSLLYAFCLYFLQFWQGGNVHSSTFVCLSVSRMTK